MELTNHLDLAQGQRLGTRPKIDLTIEFETDRAVILDDWKAQLDDVAEVLKRENMKTYRIIIEGHTDTTGDDNYNLDLSMRRARAVKDFLMNKKVPPSAIFRVEGKGESRPLPRKEGESEEAWLQRNRRVVFISCNQGESLEDCLKRAGTE